MPGGQSKKIGVDRLNKYVGCECPVCKKTFQPEDDVVVCPVCGAPHHRSCYQQNGGCALESQHALGKEWQPPQQQQQTPPPGAFCPVCGAPVAPGSQYCHSCGSLLGAAPQEEQRPPQQPGWGNPQQNGQNPNPQQGQTPPWTDPQNGPWAGHSGGYQQQNGPWNGQSGPQQGPWGGGQPGGGPWNGPNQAPPFGYGQYNPFGGINMNEEIDGISAKEYAAMVGPSAPYYLARFKAMASNRRSVTWNWGAFFFNFLYFFYRKMYAVGILLAALFVASMLPAFLYTYEYLVELMASGAAISFPLPQIVTPHMEQLVMLQSMMRMLWFVVMCLCGLWANKLYFSAAKNTIQQLRQDNRCQDVGFYIHSLALRGGVSKGVVLGVIGLLFLAYMIISYCIGMMVLG